MYADDTSGSLRGIGARQRETHARQPTTVCWRVSLSFFLSLSSLSLLMDIFMFAVVVSICCYAGWGFRLSWPPLLGQKSLVVVVGSLYLLLCCWPSADECPCAVINLLPYILYIVGASSLSLSLSFSRPSQHLLDKYVSLVVCFLSDRYTATITPTRNWKFPPENESWNSDLNKTIRSTRNFM